MPPYSFACTVRQQQVVKGNEPSLYQRIIYGFVDKIRDKISDVTITTDIIVGFPGEDDRDIEDTLEVIRYAEFASAFTFIYSKRTGTPAANMDNQIPEALTKERFNKILDLVNEMSLKNTTNHVGKIYTVLVEDINSKDEAWLTGRLDDNTLVHLEGDQSLIGKLVDVEIIRAKSYYVVGNRV